MSNEPSLITRARKNTLNQVIESDGDCLIRGLCELCPLRTRCLKNVSGIMRASFTKEQRVKEACQLLLDIELNLDTLEPPE